MWIEGINERIIDSEYKSLKRAIMGLGGVGGDGFDIRLGKIYSSAGSLVISKLFLETDKNFVVVTKTAEKAQRVYEDLLSFQGRGEKGRRGSGFENIYYFPGWEILPYEGRSPFYDIVNTRIEVLHNLLYESRSVVVTPVVNILKRIIPKKVFSGEYIKLKVNERFEYKRTLNDLIELGYAKESKVEGPGSFSIKGGIIDIYPSSYSNPVRIELNGDIIETIRTFDVVSQRSNTAKKLWYVEILPQRELIFTQESVLEAHRSIKSAYGGMAEYKEEVEKVLSKIKSREYFQGVEQLLPFFYEAKSTLLDYIDIDRSVFVLDEEIELAKRGEELYAECERLYKREYREGGKVRLKALPSSMYERYGDQKAKLKNKLYLSEFPFMQGKEGVVEGGRGKDVGLKDGSGNGVRYYEIKTSSTEAYLGTVSVFKERIKKKVLEEGYTIYILAPHKGHARRLYDVLRDLEPDLEEEGSNYASNVGTKGDALGVGGIKICVGDIAGGFGFIGESKTLVILDREIFGRSRSLRRRLKKVSSSPIESFYDLKKGDIVVHINYGIGRYLGIEMVEVLGKQKDSVLLEYADDEKLYVPVEQLNLVQKYIGASGDKVRLDKLGSNRWEKRKAQVKKEIEEIAQDLLNLYAKRKSMKGYAFGGDTKWQYEFEYGFEYEETPDQLKAVKEIKEDMERVEIMDRLICADVGFGKTEVSLRASFKAVMAGRQVAYLVPTTILCEQHYRTMSSRFELYPVKIRMLSRVQSKKEQREILEGLRRGEVDIVIGTHRMLSKDVEFLRLGLLVIDEEQRFGVRHKEAIKRLRAGVDVLSMSATPIPRTLHMSLIKVRNMSIIDTPPDSRSPIETYTTEFNEEIIKDAIEREISREGQVFFIYNRVKHIKSFARFINGLVEGVRVCVVHGQMDEEEVEKVLLDFIERRYDILVSTTILESGIDIPNANTILIDRADTLGLAQLYQLRGRVGRGGRKAYCYLFYPQDRALSEIAQKRLSVINEYTDLGSGFKIAMKDMEFRGAGNVLGVEQSGSIMSIGFELYCKLLDNAIKELESKGELDIDVSAGDVYIDLNHETFIPDEYISDERQKIELYKKIMEVEGEEDILSIREEFEDRFGKLPECVKMLLKVCELKVRGKGLGIESIVERGGEVSLIFNGGGKLLKVENIIELATDSKDIIKIDPQKSNYLYISVNALQLEDKIEVVKEILVKLEK